MKALIRIVIISLLACSHQLYAQQQPIRISGQVKDAQTFMPVSLANVVVDQHGTTTDRNGFFSITTYPKDTLKVTHVNYDLYTFTSRTGFQDTLRIFLKPRVVILREVIVRELPEEEEFKRQIMQTNIAPSVQQVNATSNINFSKKIYNIGFVPQMDSEDNHLMYIRGPQGVNFMGIGKAIRDISQGNNMLKPLNINSGVNYSNFDFFKTLKRDTLRVDTLLIENPEIILIKD